MYKKDTKLKDIKIYSNYIAHVLLPEIKYATGSAISSGDSLLQ